MLSISNVYFITSLRRIGLAETATAEKPLCRASHSQITDSDDSAWNYDKLPGSFNDIKTEKSTVIA